MKCKRGFLLAEETLKIIIALISISFLIYFLTALYFTSQNSKGLEQAEASLEFLIKEINDGRDEVEIYNPKDWVILSWPYGNENKLPNSCSNLGWGDCVCITKDLNLGTQLLSLLPFTENVIDKFLDRSDKEGVCRENTQKFIVKGDVNEQSPIVIESPMTLIIDYENKKITKK